MENLKQIDKVKNIIHPKIYHYLYFGDFSILGDEHLMKYKRLRIEKLLHVQPFFIRFDISNGRFKGAW